jgi:hypothetical protein
MRMEGLGMAYSAPRAHSEEAALKDAVLDRLGNVANVAQFVSFEPGHDPQQRFSRVWGYEPNQRFGGCESGVRTVLETSPEESVNVRSFRPDRPKESEFLYGLSSVKEVVRAVRRLAADGFYTIVNETVDVNDGGVSGVSYAGILEFVPGDTPRGVEKPGTLAVRQELGLRMLEAVYGFSPELEYERATRVEFSIHPLPRGFRRSHTIVWELEPAEDLRLEPNLDWPNQFSRMLGDKAFGLLVADTLGLPVPATTVIPRALAPFRFGRPTGTAEPWIRTCPKEPIPGLLKTQHGWTDPFALMTEQDPEGTLIASVLYQEGVPPMWSGALAVSTKGELTVQGVAGSGEPFMQGQVAPQPLPASVVELVTELQRGASATLGPVGMEWVHDGTTAWVVQLHKGASPSSGRVVFPGDAQVMHRFDVTHGIAELRKLMERIDGTREGVVLVGDVGITSHMGDILRRARIPSRIEPNA